MLHKMESEKIKDWGNNYQETPKNGLWDIIESRLDNSITEGKQHINKSTTKTFRLSWKHYAIAANLLLIIAAIIGFSDYYTNHNPTLFSYNVNQKPLKMEEIKAKENSSDFYSVKNIITLSKAYESQGF